MVFASRQRRKGPTVTTEPDETPLSLAVLSDKEICERLHKRNLVIHPLLHEITQVQGCKVDLRLSGIFYEVKHSAVESYDPLFPQEDDYRREMILPVGEPYILHPGMLALAPTFENISMPRDLLGILQGRSSLGRLGIIVHATAGFVDPGYKGSLTLELSNLGHLPVALYPLNRAAAIAFIKISGNVKQAYFDETASPIDPSKGKPSGSYSSPLSEPSKFKEDWENTVFRRIRERRLTQEGGC
jgi:dCTP deaminase